MEEIQPPSTTSQPRDVGTTHEPTFESPPVYSFPFVLQRESDLFTLPSLASTFTLAKIPTRPRCSPKTLSCHVALPCGSRRVTVPARLGLRWGNQGELQWAEESTHFWLELTKSEPPCVQARLFLSPDGKGSRLMQEWVVTPAPFPPQTKEELAADDPFRSLAEGKVMGRDRFREVCCGEPPLFFVNVREKRLVLRESNWLVLKEGQWETRESSPHKTVIPMARLRMVDGHLLFFEGWDQSGYRLVGPLTAQTPSVPLRVEELFGAIRVRSEREVSCLLEKRCCIVRIGDWVCKEGGRWRVLRTHGDREAFTKSKQEGELFVLEAIEAVGGVKRMRGLWFDASHSQMTPVDLPTLCARRARTTPTRRGL